MDDIERLWTHEETAKYLHVSLWTLTHLGDEQQPGPTVFRVGRNRRYDPVEVRSWLRRNAADPAGPPVRMGRHVSPESGDALVDGSDPGRSVSLTADQTVLLDPGPVTA